MESVIVYKPQQTFQHTCKHCGVAYYNSKPEGETSYCSFPCLLSSLHGKPMDVEKRMLKDIDLPKDLRILYLTTSSNRLTRMSGNTKALSGGCSPEYYHIRDRAMMSIAFLACGRINEVLRLERKQFDFESEEGFTGIHNFYVSKRKKATIINGYACQTDSGPKQKWETSQI